jgi:hypothetical protein
MMIGKGNRSTWRKPAPMSLYLPQIPHDLTGREPGKPAANLLSYGTAKNRCKLSTKHIYLIFSCSLFVKTPKYVYYKTIFREYIVLKETNESYKGKDIPVTGRGGP